MPSADGPQGPHDHDSQETPLAASQTVELQLFESLVHHLVEKGVLTRNDALSVIQAVAEVKRGEQAAGRFAPGGAHKEMILLERLYASFELLSERPSATHVRSADNVLQLRPPLHADKPQFPKDN